jgi:hypothetical protein
MKFRVFYWKQAFQESRISVTKKPSDPEEEYFARQEME